MKAKYCVCTSLCPLGCPLSYGAIARSALEYRLELKHPELAKVSCLEDVCCHICCRPCAIAQELRAVKKYNAMWPTEQAFEKGVVVHLFKQSPASAKMER